MTSLKNGQRLLVALLAAASLFSPPVFSAEPETKSTPDAAFEGTEALPDTYPVKATPTPAETPVETVTVSPTPKTTPAPVATAHPTASATGAPVATPVPTATPTPRPTMTPILTPTPKPSPGAAKDVDPKVQAACNEVYATKYQEKLRTACTDGATQAMKTGWANAASQCRADHSLGERQRLICQVGATIGDELHAGKSLYPQRAAACRDLFPIISPVDVYFQESCLSGADLQAHSRSKATIGNCRWLVPNDRGFLAPCAAGISLTAGFNSGEKTIAADLNKLCSQYFDKAQFNLGYRSCLNGLALSLGDEKKVDVVRRCGEVSSERSGSERGSCIIGYELYRYLHKPEDLTKRFKACGDSKVTYEERDTLACLTANSLTDFMDRAKARKACKEIFTGHKNHSRADCERML